MARRKNGSCSVPSSARRGTHVEVPREADPNHHLWRNGRLWWVAFTVHHGYRQERIRSSLGTSDVEEARCKRDAILDLFASAEGCEVSLRFAPPRVRDGARQMLRQVAPAQAEPNDFFPREEG
jgi:hypothetical protein